MFPTETILEIAEQTNLLSLNAAIEVARTINEGAGGVQEIAGKTGEITWTTVEVLHLVSIGLSRC